MKNIVLLLFCVSLMTPAFSQLKTKAHCDPFVVDVLDGKLNGVGPDFAIAQIKAKLPCFTSEDAASSKCGDIISYADEDVKFYAGRNYVEIGAHFKGRLTIPLMGGKRGSFFKWLGQPKLKDEGWDAFQTQYGCLILYYNAAARVIMIRFSTKSTDEINLCE